MLSLAIFYTIGVAKGDYICLSYFSIKLFYYKINVSNRCSLYRYLLVDFGLAQEYVVKPKSNNVKSVISETQQSLKRKRTDEVKY